MQQLILTGGSKTSSNTVNSEYCDDRQGNLASNVGWCPDLMEKEVHNTWYQIDLDHERQVSLFGWI